MTVTKTRLALLVSILALAVTAPGCGYSEDEWQAQLAKYGELDGKHRATSKKLDATTKELAKRTDELEAERKRVAQLEKDLEAAGFNMKNLKESLASSGTELSKLNAILAERERALAEYKKRAAQLARIKKRFELLAKKLNELTTLGLAVKIRNNRMVISLPGDVLFESGKERLKTDGRKVLKQVAGIIGGDASLRKRTYQVAGHTDNVEIKGGVFGDNWGLSLMRARTVLLYLINPTKGNLPPKNWSAAGFSDTDPVADNGTREGKQQNRRCELIVVPSAEEMLDLKAITQK